MGKTNKGNIQYDKRLADEVHKCPCLFLSLISFYFIFTISPKYK